MKRLTLILLILIISSEAYTQESKILIGLKASPIHKHLSIYTIRPTSFSFSTGFMLDYYFSNKFCLKTALTFDRKGFSGEVEYETTTVDNPEGDHWITRIHKENYDYLVLPILLSYSKSTESSFYFNAGPYVAYLLRRTSFSDYEGWTDLTNFTKRLDLGLSLGFGWEIKIGKRTVLDIGIIENLGLIDTQKFKNSLGNKVKTNSLEMKFGFKVKI
jgi:hypothetical protein